MVLLKQPNRWSCLPTSFAMHTGNLEKLLELIGHDGSEVINPDLPEPLNRRNFSLFEIVPAMWLLGFSVTTFHRFSYLESGGGLGKFIQMDHGVSFNRVMKENIPGVLMGATHAAAWDGQNVNDPQRGVLPLREWKHTALIFCAVTRRSI